MNPNPENLEKSKSNDNTMNVQSKNSNSKDDFDILDVSFEDIINKNETENLNAHLNVKIQNIIRINLSIMFYQF